MSLVAKLGKTEGTESSQGVQKSSPFEEVVAAACAADPGAKFHTVSPKQSLVGTAASLARFFQPITSAATAHASSLIEGFSESLGSADPLVPRGIQLNPYSHQIGVGPDSTSVLVVPELIPSSKVQSSTPVGFLLPSFAELYGEYDPRNESGATSRQLRTRDQESPRESVVLKAPVGIVLFCESPNQIAKGDAPLFDGQKTLIVWSRAAFNQAAYELSGAFDKLKNPVSSETEMQVFEQKLSTQKFRSVGDLRAEAVTLDQLNRSLSASHFLAGLVVDFARKSFFNDVRGEIDEGDLIIPRLWYSKGALNAFVIQRGAIESDGKLIRVNLAPDGTACASS